MSAGRHEFINLNVNGRHLKPIPEVHCANGGVGGGAAMRIRNKEAIFLFSVILAQTICMVIGFIVFASIVDKAFEQERETQSSLNKTIISLSRELEQLKKNVTTISNRNLTGTPRPPQMPPLHGTAEKMKVVTVETVEEYPEIESMRNEKAYDDDSDEEDEGDEEPQTADNAEVYINGNSGAAPTNVNNDILRLRDRRRPELQNNLGKQQPLAANSSARNATGQPETLRNPNFLVESNDDDDDDDEEDEEDEGKQTADNTEIFVNSTGGSAPTNLHLNASLLRELEARHRLISQRLSEKQQQQVGNLAARNTARPAAPAKTHSQRRSESANTDHVERNDENLKPPQVETKHKPLKEFEMLRTNTNREDDREYSKPRIARSTPEKRHVNPVQDSGQPRMNSINPTALSAPMDSISEKNLASITAGLWPAAHFNSYDLSSQRPYSADDCPREIQNNQKKWAPSEVPGSEHFDLKNSETITVKREGLYFVYSQIYFYKDRSIFGYLIKRENQAVLQCSIHTPTNRTSNGSGTTCFTAGLVYLKANDVLKLEIFTESGKCVRWGPGKSFIGLYKLPVESSTFV